MDSTTNQYAGLEPSDLYADTPVILEDTQFDAPEFTAALFDQPTEPSSPAHANEQSNAHISPTQEFRAAPAVAEPVNTAPLQFINTTALNPHNNNNVALPPLNYTTSNRGHPATLYPPMPVMYDYSYPTNYMGNHAHYPPPPMGSVYREPSYALKNQQPLPDTRRSSAESSWFEGGPLSSDHSVVEGRFPEFKPEPGVDPIKRPDNGPNGEPLKNGRMPRVTRKNKPKPDPREWYGPIPAPPANWGPKDEGGRHLFKYTEHGELERGKTYGPRDMCRYLYGPKPTEDFEPPERLDGVPAMKNKVRQGLTIWIGWVAPQSNDRYPHETQSQKCRFRDCDEQNHTIKNGFPRVIFDERMNVDGEAIDPFHNAGYAHLYCFEKHYDLVGAIVNLDVRIDNRDFKREINLCKMSRLYPNIQDEIDSWWRAEYPKWIDAKQRGYRRRDWNYADSLSYRLVCHTLENSPETRIKVRQIRAGVDISKHKGDLEYQRYLTDCMKNNLVDDNGDPIQDAQEFLKQLPPLKPGQKRRAATPSNTMRPTSSNTSMSPTRPYFDNSGQVHHLNPAVYQVPYPPPYSPTEATFMAPPYATHYPPGHDLQPLDFAGQPAPLYPYQQQMPLPQQMLPPQQMPQQPTGTSGRKRGRDEMLAEDQQTELASNGDQATVQETPAKKRRLDEPSSTPEEAPVEYPPIPELDRYDDIRLQEDFGHNEVELDDNIVFDMIDKEMSNSKSSDKGSDDITGPDPSVEQPEPDAEQQPAEDNILDDLEYDGNDLFADDTIAPVSTALEVDVNKKLEDG
ncbi:hypothetical protein F4819DRAFT_3301 [Hypoxylon fuscum]|nr:hypothetical protein F4819DRAFT_3301 [Hypoxylon fuscum]